ncbi:Z1 domain-containing protein [Streptomyces sp. NPDC048156]|uniref:Z1 domain-containing protein n=1 Tax=Streptomyces sp. NPDC048156 TaxID=3365502 RepID=UPI0037235A57
MSDDDANILLEIHTSALAGMANSPRHFARWAALAADEDHPDADLTEETFRAHLVGGDEALLALWSRHLNDWDFAESAPWSPETAPRTPARRTAVYGRLRLGEDLRKVLDEAVRVSVIAGPTVITREFTPWYTQERAAARTFYWRAYERKLRDKGWSDAAVASLDGASRAVVERLSDPEQPAARQAKGLVVGYVQSGKTANFTGVTAKAIDAGYRLVIVLGGTLNMLRAQTQRRLDMELVGQENILGGADPSDVDSLVGIDYVGDDAEWDDFVSHGGRPSTRGAFDIDRLTTRDKDYKSLATGIRALEYDKRERTLPLHDPSNLHHAAARVMVVKKNKAVLTKLVKDLKQIHGILGELPALIIDDESDQASVNTSNPKKWEQGRTERTAINSLISQLLTLLPRAQYVGYTATPFANVFVDPSDGEDIFPSDFLISLPRPTGYMGVQDFHDLDSPVEDEERTVANSQEKAHVRGIYDSTGDRLQEALDAFVLSGALKLYRLAAGVPEKNFRHHTMLVHESVKMDDHAKLALRINTMWHEASQTSAAGHARLETLWESDFAPVTEARAEDLPCPASYEELRPHVMRARQLIGSTGNPVMVVNGDSDRYFDQLDLDFDSSNVWKILVGGTKLSRGFTVEGLTITYYRRTTQQADTLMQMGRWFGFRPGYRDLVRLYIGREETYGRDKSADLYEAFEAVCRDEELFRTQLSRYAELVDGKPQLTPAQVPPLVSQHLPWLKPAARNKMFNAELVEVRSPGQIIEPTAHPNSAVDLRHNTMLWRPLLDGFHAEREEFTYHHPATGRTYRLSALMRTLSHARLMDVLQNLRWWNAAPFAPHLEYLNSLLATPHLVDDWLLISPQHTSTTRALTASIAGSTPLALSHRQRRRVEIFGSISDPKHRATALRIAGALPRTEDAATERHVRPRRGSILLYPVIEDSPTTTIINGTVDPAKVAMVFSLVPPASALPSGQPVVRFRAIDSGREAAIIEAT